MMLNLGGRQDRLLSATEFLLKRIQNIMALRKQNGLDPTPTLSDIEKTHVLFVNSHFKPFVQTAFEYQKFRAQSPILGGETRIELYNLGEFISHAVLHFRSGVVSAATAGHTWRWVAYPGERLITRAKWVVGSNELDEYFSHDYAIYRNYKLSSHKKLAYDLCAGQQIVNPATIIPYTGAALSVAGVGSIGGSVTATASDSIGLGVNVTNGYQTVKTGTAHSLGSVAATNYKPTSVLEVTMPLLFPWSSGDVRQAFPVVSVPNQDKVVLITLASLTDLCGGLVVTGNGSGTSTGAGLSIAATAIPVCDLYVCHIFIQEEVQKIFIQRIGFSLCRVHKRHTERVSSVTDGNILLSSLKWPIEVLYVGFKSAGQYSAPTSNDAWTLEYADGWHVFANCRAVSAGVGVTADDDGGSGTVSTLHVQWLEMSPVIQTLGVQAHAVDLYKSDTPAVLYNQFLPLMSSERLSSPTDPGLYCIPFCFYAGFNQPSGHYNSSRGREFYLRFSDALTTGGVAKQNSADAIGGANTANADLLADADVINFVLYGENTALLRFTT
jgi:hypothetical protein